MDKRYQTVIPYTTSKYGQILLQLKLGSSLTGTFCLDTGSSSTWITDTLATKLHLPPIPAIGTDGAPLLLSAGKQAQMVTVPLLKLNNFRLLNAPCLLLNQKPLLPLIGQPVDGILGAGVLAIYPMYFDFTRHQITLFSPSPLTIVELRGVGMDHAVVLPVADLTTNNRFKFACPVVMVNGKYQVQENLLVDTGAGATLISEQTARYLHLKPTGSNYYSPSFFGDISVVQAYLPTVSLGGVNLGRLLLRYTPDISEAFGSHIGLDVLSRFYMLLDYKQKTMYLKPITDLHTKN